MKEAISIHFETASNITTVQKLLGHKNLTTTQIYGEVMGSTIVRDLKKCQKGKD